MERRNGRVGERDEITGGRERIVRRRERVKRGG